ncbi:uncharacterized protein C8Q71DRAFT_474535 [Rhodofomes roseus]|uniref:RING-type domain-containing protein n=1 Tax=Rhodofomes roseus TaxID=34475 RepID=A0A4Y9YSC7_9APHY|nr:uncharacterized protein C8Q71DRAFT_474535 [Rhodofomes roseus]KAH9840036.1 hypothetical protein C8Q71DRAFT_474535 [Rhodofomes roseus]TFY64653.1 hypothetical protein EVJ58_g2483 [Rhodofomes roseus]
MPPSTHTVTQSSHRRSTASARQRENRSHLTHTGSMRRRKSRSPDARILEEIPAVLMTTSESGSQRRKRKSISSAPSISELVTQSSIDEVPQERGRRGKAKARVQSFAEDGDAYILREHATASNSIRSKKKERSKSREIHSRGARTATPGPAEDGDVGIPVATYDSSELVRLKCEIESLRKQLHMSKKTINKQSKVIDELRSEVANSAKSQKEQTKELDKLKGQSKKSEELVSNFETNLSCQICMELIAKPHGLSPCGHVLCQTCLQEWFRSAPAGEDEMIDEDEPDALLYRKKTCPCCRTVVTSRPIPLFLVKSLTSALEKAKAQPGVPRRPTPPPDDDPWEGIFADPDDPDNFWPMDEDDDEDDFDDEYDDDDDDWPFDGYGTADDDEHYDGPYERPRWEPPSVNATLDDYPFDDVNDNDLRMLRRGATLQMIDMFRMSYTHQHGLCARVDDHNTVYLGWNIRLHDDDESGEGYIDWITSDMQFHPERWDVREERNGSWTAWQLAPEGEGDQDYETTDSEAWSADLADDEDF